MKKNQYIHKIALYKINTFEHNVTKKSCKIFAIHIHYMDCKY